MNRTGFPTKNSTYDADLVKLCDKAGVKKLSMHDLCHTMATRYCERPGANYKALSEMLGHKSTQITMDLYVHNTDVALEKEMEAYSNYHEAQLGERKVDDDIDVSPEIKARIRSEYKEELLAELEEEIRDKILKELNEN